MLAIAEFENIRYNVEERTLILLDQRSLPQQKRLLHLTKIEEVWLAIKTLAVRGAPAIGIAAAWGLAMQLQNFEGTLAEVAEAVRRYQVYLVGARPTAVNLAWALERMERCAYHQIECDGANLAGLQAALLGEAEAIQREDAEMCRCIGEHGLMLLEPGMTLLTHCNAGALATARYGTALAPIYLGQERGYNFAVYVDETRPLLQGARLTAWELQQAGVDLTLICDNMAAQVLASGAVDAVLVGADRVAANGDAANKIGTMGLALLAAHFEVPFYVFCPSSTLDPNTSHGSQIVIEERAADEITVVGEQRMAPEGIKVYNPAFDVTPSRYITAIITERGVFRAPYAFDQR